MINKQLKSTKEYDMKNSVITIESIYSEEKKVKDLLKEHLQARPVKSVKS